MRVSYLDWLENARVYSSTADFIYSPEVFSFTSVQGNNDFAVDGVTKKFNITGYGVSKHDTFTFIDQQESLIHEHCSTSHTTYGTVTIDTLGDTISNSVMIDVIFDVSTDSVPARLQLCRTAQPSGYSNTLSRRFQTNSGAGMVIATVTSQISKGCAGLTCGNGKHIYVVGDEEIMSFQGNGLSPGDELFWVLSLPTSKTGQNCTSENKQGAFESFLTVKDDGNSSFLAGLGSQKTVSFGIHSNNVQWVLCYKFKGEVSFSTFENLVIVVHTLIEMKDLTNPQQIITGGTGIDSSSKVYVFQHFAWKFSLHGFGIGTGDQVKLVERGSDCSKSTGIAGTDGSDGSVVNTAVVSNWGVAFETSLNKIVVYNTAFQICYQFTNDNWIELMKNTPVYIYVMHIHPPKWDDSSKGGISGAWEKKYTAKKEDNNEQDERGQRTVRDRVVVVGSESKDFKVKVSNVPDKDNVQSALTVKYKVECANSEPSSKFLASSKGTTLDQEYFTYTVEQLLPSTSVDVERIGCELRFIVEVQTTDQITLESDLYPFKSHGLLVLGRADFTQKTIVVADLFANIKLEGEIPTHYSSVLDAIAWIPKSPGGGDMKNSFCNNATETDIFEVKNREGQSVKILSTNVLNSQQHWERVLCYSFAGEPPVLYPEHFLFVRHLIGILIEPVNTDVGPDVTQRSDTVVTGDGRTIGRTIFSLRLANTVESGDLDYPNVVNRYNWNVQLELPEWVTRKDITDTDKDVVKLVPMGKTCTYAVAAEVLKFENIADFASTPYTHQLLPASTAAASTAAALFDLNGRPPLEDQIANPLGAYQLCYQHGDTTATPTTTATTTSSADVAFAYANNPHLVLETTCDTNYFGPSCTKCPGFVYADGLNSTCSGHGKCIGSGSHLDVTIDEEFKHFVVDTEGGGLYKLGDCACNMGAGVNTGWDGVDGGTCNVCGGSTKTERWVNKTEKGTRLQLCQDCGGGFQRGLVTPTHLNKIIQAMSKNGYGGNTVNCNAESTSSCQEACVKCAPSYFGNKQECIMCPTRIPNGQPYEQQCSGHGECRNSGENPPEYLDFTKAQLEELKTDKDNPVCTCRTGSGFEGLDCGECAAGWYYQGGVACVECESFPDRCLGGRDETHQCVDGYAGDKCLECSREPAFNDT